MIDMILSIVGIAIISAPIWILIIGFTEKAICVTKEYKEIIR